MISFEEAHNRFEYDPQTGLLRRKEAPRGPHRWGISYSPFTRHILIDGVRYNSIHFRWFMATGNWPKGEIDHINRNDADHRFSNLRDVTTAQNSYNTAKHNPNGVKGVSFVKGRKSKPWLAQIRIGGRKVNLGRFATLEEAHEVWLNAAATHHGEYESFECYVKNPNQARGDI